MSTINFILLVIVLLLALFFFKSLVIVPEANQYVIERLGKFQSVFNVGIHFKIPFIDKIRQKISLKEAVIDFPPQSVITRDNVTMEIDAVVFLRVVEPRLFTYGSQNPIVAIEKLTATTLRNIIGELELQETLTSREQVNNKMLLILDQATDKWGIKITRVEIKNIQPPLDIQEAMEKQMRAERERREMILQAEGSKQANITRAEGEQEAMLKLAHAEKEAAIARAQGEAESIALIAKARAQEIELIRSSDPSKEYLALENFKTFGKLANSNNTKIIIPSDMSNLATIATGWTELTTDKEKGTNKENQNFKMA